MTTEQLILECSNGALVVLFFLLRMSTRVYMVLYLNMDATIEYIGYRD